MTKALDSSRQACLRGFWLGVAGWTLLAVTPSGAVPLHLAQAPAVTPAPVQPAPPPPPAPAPAAPVPPPSVGTVPKTPESAGTPATVIDGQQVESLLGKQVLSGTGEDMGHIADIIVDKTGAMRAAVIDFGGFLGVGSRRIAVDWSALHFLPRGSRPDHVTVDIPRNDLRVAPTYKEGEQVVVLGRPAEPKPAAAPPPADPAAPAPAAAAPAPAAQ